MRQNILMGANIQLGTFTLSVKLIYLNVASFVAPEAGVYVWVVVLSTSESKEKKTKTSAHNWLTVPTPAADKTSPGSRWRSLGGIVESAKIQRWQVTQFTQVFLTFREHRI